MNDAIQSAIDYTFSRSLKDDKAAQEVASELRDSDIIPSWESIPLGTYVSLAINEQGRLDRGDAGRDRPAHRRQLDALHTLAGRGRDRGGRRGCRATSLRERLDVARDDATVRPGSRNARQLDPLLLESKFLPTVSALAPRALYGVSKTN